MSDWGTAAGDVNADAIIADRNGARPTLTITNLVFFVPLVGTAVWYALTGSRAAVAIEIILAAIYAGGWVQSAFYATHTLLTIAETRTRLLEIAVQDLNAELRSLRR